MRVVAAIAAGLVLMLAGGAAHADELRVLSAGAYRQIVVALAPQFERATGHRLIIDNDTVGALARRIEGGETFDVAVLSPSALADLTRKGRIAAGSTVEVARVGISVMVREGAPRPDISTPEAFKQALLHASSVAFIDPASGGSSGIYLVGLFERLGIAAEMRGKARLKQGGYVADLVAAGTAELGLHNTSEIVGHAGVVLVGPLPDGLQNFTTYAAGLSATTPHGEAARALVALLAGPNAAPVLVSRGMESARP